MAQEIRCEDCGETVTLDYTKHIGPATLFDWICSPEGKWLCPVCQKLREPPSLLP